ncbi:putative endonuclease [Luteibacter rhizovicinus]|uniref:UPF0102 protein EC912_10419 n=1 Tax=Luteibacter rhizovicinus TaxID=242606 RepID=A0A4R3YNC0_9GAMM|nr:YraN family protein [Luteibacter rhizovicinus]TCV93826.1 putative endonuclease [Luteibacter rhizovicinus]
MKQKPSVTPRRAAGDRCEARARTFLEGQGLTFVEANYQTRCGEIDLVMREGDTLVFVEVRYRSGRAFGGAAASVTASKQQKLIRAASFYLLRYPRDAQRPCRFDVVAFEGDAPPDWHRGAFDAV